MTDPGTARRRELADFLRTRRARLDPLDVGLPVSGRRRTPGLRREEVADLAGVSPSWYTWLEQGRKVHPSVQVLDSLARALRLDRIERAHLFRLARPEDPVFVEDAPPSAALVQTIRAMPFPAVVTNRWWYYDAWNVAHAAMFGPLDALLEPDRRHMLWLMFSVPEVRERIEDWEEVARATVAQFRISLGERPDDERARRLVDELSAVYPEFATWWAEHDVEGRPDTRRVIRHPEAGILRFDIVALRAHDTGYPRVIVWSPVPGTDTAERLRRLLDERPPRRTAGRRTRDLRS